MFLFVASRWVTLNRLDETHVFVISLLCFICIYVNYILCTVDIPIYIYVYTYYLHTYIFIYIYIHLSASYQPCYRQVPRWRFLPVISLFLQLFSSKIASDHHNIRIQTGFWLWTVSRKKKKHFSRHPIRPSRWSQSLRLWLSKDPAWFFPKPNTKKNIFGTSKKIPSPHAIFVYILFRWKKTTPSIHHIHPTRRGSVVHLPGWVRDHHQWVAFQVSHGFARRWYILRRGHPWRLTTQKPHMSGKLPSIRGKSV